MDLFVARLDRASFTGPRPVPGINTRADESDAAWLGGTRAIVFARADAKGDAAVRLQLARCDGTRYADATPLALSFNTAGGTTFGPAIDWNKPGELLVTGVAKAPRAGGLDIYRMKAPAADGKDGCVD